MIGIVVLKFNFAFFFSSLVSQLLREPVLVVICRIGVLAVSGLGNWRFEMILNKTLEMAKVGK